MRRPPRLTGCMALVVLGSAACSGGSGTGVDETPAAVALSPAAPELTFIGDTLTLTASVTSASGGSLSTPVTWTSLAPAVATVTAAGLVTAVSEGSAGVQAQAGAVTAQVSVDVEQAPAAMSKNRGDGQAGTAGHALADSVIVGVTDAGGTAVPGDTVTWTPSGTGSVDGASAVTDVDGLARAVWVLGDAAGEQTLQVSVGTSSATFVATALLGDTTAPRIDSIRPQVLEERGTGTVHGSNFGATIAGNTVVLDGDTVLLQSASATELVFTVPTYDCKPPRSAQLTVGTQTGQDSRGTAVTPDPDSVVTLAVQEMQIRTDGAECIHLEAGALGAEYLVGVLSASAAVSGLTPVAITGVAGESVSTLGPPRKVAGRRAADLATPIGPRPAGAGDARVAAPLDRHWALEGVLRARERRLIDELGGIESVRAASAAYAGPRRAAAIDSLPAVGDTVTATTGFNGGCSQRDTVQAITRLVGDHAIWLWDVENPGPDFTLEELTTFDSLYSATTRLVLNDYYGDFEDLDGNGRLFVLMTKEVNREDGLGGFVSSADLLSPAQCPQSNFAEIFHGVVPDTAGTFGEVREKDQIVDFYPSLIAHETTHILQLSQTIFNGAGQKTSWEIEGGATLAEQLVGYEVMGDGSGRDLGINEMIAGIDWYFDWLDDMTRYFGRTTDESRVAMAPEQCSWVGRESEGNDGPCRNDRAVYGVPAMLLRYVLDRFGAGFAGGEQALMRELTGSAPTGYATIEAVTGEPIEVTLAHYYAALWADGRHWNTITSWDMLDVLQGFDDRSTAENTVLVPYQSQVAEPELSVSVRGGSSVFLRWMPVLPHEPTSLVMRTPAGADLPATMALWIFRLQ